MIDSKKRLKELKSYCRNTIVRPDFLPDDWRWAMTYHILKTYFVYTITNEVIEKDIVEVICFDVNLLWGEIRNETSPEDYFLISTYVAAILQDWLNVSLSLEEYEVSYNLKNIFDFCEDE
jgi:hypothetical protein